MTKNQIKQIASWIMLLGLLVMHLAPFSIMSDGVFSIIICLIILIRYKDIKKYHSCYKFKDTAQVKLSQTVTVIYLLIFAFIGVILSLHGYLSPSHANFNIISDLWVLFLAGPIIAIAIAIEYQQFIETRQQVNNNIQRTS
jgi:hypothetical protein